MDKLQDIYYQPDHLWKRQKAIRKLKDFSKEKPKVVIETSILASIFTCSTTPAERPHYEVTIPSEMQQFDLLYMPLDMLGISTSTSSPESMSLSDIKLQDL